jgi:D-alanine-D-alanine ligase
MAPKHKMKVCVLYPYYEGYTPEEMLAEDGDPRDYLPSYPNADIAFIKKTTEREQIEELLEKEYDIFLNLCDGAADETEWPGIGVVKALEDACVPFTGAPSHFFEPTREDMKVACKATSVKTPGHYLVKKMRDLSKLNGLRYPLITKHPSSYASIGMTKNSRVENREQLESEVKRMLKLFGQVLIEEFIDGREFTVLVAENAKNYREPIVFTPIEFRFPQGESFKHYDLKWVGFADMKTAVCEDAAIREKLEWSAKTLFLGMKGESYARFDFRVDANGDPYVVDVNPNCGMFYPPRDPGSADSILYADERGHEGFFEIITAAAIKRAKERRRARRTKAALSLQIAPSISGD